MTQAERLAHSIRWGTPWQDSREFSPEVMAEAQAINETFEAPASNLTPDSDFTFGGSNLTNDQELTFGGVQATPPSSGGAFDGLLGSVQNPDTVKPNLTPDDDFTFGGSNITDDGLTFGGLPSGPTQPAPTQPAPTQPAPTQPAPTQPAPTQPAPTQPAPSEPAPNDPFVPGGDSGKFRIASFLPGSRNDEFYTRQFNQMALNDINFQKQQKQANELRQAAAAQPSPGMPDDPFAWMDSPLPQVEVNDRGYANPFPGYEPQFQNAAQGAGAYYNPYTGQTQNTPVDYVKYRSESYG
jgi:hypothetical protein